MSKIKLGFYTDIHFSGRNPRYRIDNTPQATIEEMDEIYEECHKAQVDAILFGGDLMDTHKMSSNELVNKINRVLDKWKIHTYAIVGQHDVEGYNENSYKTSALSLIAENSPYFHIVWDEEVICDKIKVHACHVWNKPETFFKKKLNDEYFHLGMMHHLLYNKKAIFDVIDVNEVSCEYDLVLSGDLHCGYPLTNTDGTYFYNPGSVCRRSYDERFKRPKYAFIEIDGKEIEITEKEINCSGGPEIFHKDEIDSLRESADYNSDQYVIEMNKLDSESVDIFDLVEKVGINTGVSIKIIKKIKSYRTEDVS